MAAPEISTKRVAINKAQAQMVGILAAASFVTVFCLVAAHAIFVQNSYQSRVIKQQEATKTQLKSNLDSTEKLIKSYKKFDNASTNILGGNSTGTGDKDGKNARLVLDALPSTYDYPAVATTIEKLLVNNNFKVGNIVGIDDQLNQQNTKPTDKPTPVAMPFSFSVTNTDYASIQKLIGIFQQPIRPIQIDSITMSGGNQKMTLNIDAHTYYQAGKNLNIPKQAVK